MDVTVFHTEERADIASIWKKVPRKLLGSNGINRKRIEKIT
jgi:hypothetical protein